MNETDVVKHLDLLNDFDWLWERIADEFRAGAEPPGFEVAARFLTDELVDWTELRDFDEGDLPCAIIRAAKETLDVKLVRAAVREVLRKKWPKLSAKLTTFWEEEF